MFASKLLSVVAVAGFIVGCANAETGEVEKTEETPQAKIIGANDLTPVREDGANIPEKYRSLIDAFGVIGPMGCTATHIGNGVVISAGHCFNARPQRQDNTPCPNLTVTWGYRVDKAAYLTSKCTNVLTKEQNGDRDYALFQVDHVPPVKVDVDFSKRPALGTTITILSHPRRRPLEWSKTCQLKAASKGDWGKDQFSHQCDTEGGSSGATILDDKTLNVIGIHDGGLVPWNYGTYLTNTPIAEFAELFQPSQVDPPGSSEE